MVRASATVNAALGSWLLLSAVVFRDFQNNTAQALQMIAGGTIATFELRQYRVPHRAGLQSMTAVVVAVGIVAILTILSSNDKGGLAASIDLLVAFGILGVVGCRAYVAKQNRRQWSVISDQVPIHKADVRKTLELSVLDIVPIPVGSDAGTALRASVDLAQLADQLGFKRYWVAERHGLEASAGSAPEVLLSHIATRTIHLRVGTGGIFLPQYPLENVVETFRALDELHPGRVDVGLDGTNTLTEIRRRGLQGSSHVEESHVDESEIERLAKILGGRSPVDERAGSRVLAEKGPPLPMWLVGCDIPTARLAARCGVGFVYAHYLDPDGISQALQIYRSEFRPSSYFADPHTFIAAMVICAESDKRAGALASALDLGYLRIEENRPMLWPSAEMAAQFPYTAEEQSALAAIRHRIFVGAPRGLANQLRALATQHHVDEIMIMTITHDHPSRRHSYQLLADVLRVSPDQDRRFCDGLI
jgi:luciferase family oxidoreductase group 1